MDGENCVGGISGSVGTASVAGLLNTTLGVAEYLGFNANSISLTGSTEGITIGGKGKELVVLLVKQSVVLLVRLQ